MRELTKQSVLFLLNQNKKTTGLDADTLDGKDSTAFLDKSETATLSGDITLGSTLTVSGATTLSGPSTFSGATEVSGAINLSNGTINTANIPTADPLVSGQLWNNAGVLTISA